MKKIKIKKIIKIVMPSSLIQQNFGENVTKHGFLLWDVETKTFTAKMNLFPIPDAEIRYNPKIKQNQGW